jgi:hypothetical protein
MTKDEFIQEWIKNVKGSIWKNEIILEWQKLDNNEFEAAKAEEAIDKDKKFLKFLIKKLK